MAIPDLAMLARAALANIQYGADGSPRNAFGNAIGEDPRYPDASMVILPSGEGKYLTAAGIEVPYPGVGRAGAGAPAGVVSSIAPPAGTTQGGVQAAPAADLPIGPLSPLVAALSASSTPLTAGGATISRALQRKTPEQNIALIQAALARFLGRR